MDVVVENQEPEEPVATDTIEAPIDQNGSINQPVEEVVTHPEAIDNVQEEEIEEEERVFDLNVIRDQFVTKFKYLIEQHGFTSLQTTPVWMVSETLIPLSRRGNNTATERWAGGGALRTRYSEPTNYVELFCDDDHEHEKVMSEFKGRPFKLVDSACLNSPHVSTPFNFHSETEVKLGGVQVFTMFAYNQLGQHSAPLVVFPRTDDSSLEANLNDKPITRAFCMETSNTGDLDNINKFINWLSLFGMQLEQNTRPTILLVSSLLYLKLSNLIQSQDEYKKLIDLLTTLNFYLLVYPAAGDVDLTVYKQFCAEWRESLRQTTLLRNPNDETSFVQTYFGAMAAWSSTIMSSDVTASVRTTFNQLLIERLNLNLEPMPPQGEIPQGGGEENGHVVDNEDTEIDAVATTSNPTKLSEMSEQEIDEYVEWIEAMSKIGCLSIKHVFLRDLFLKTQKQNQGGKELLASEKSWQWLVDKNRAKFKSKTSIVNMNETEYFVKWSDQEYWRKQYVKYARTQLHLKNSDHLWTFEIIQFPYVTKDGMLRMPESDYAQRPRQLKPRVSVLFAYNVTGDYTAPFFVFPSNFNDDDEAAAATTNSNEKIDYLVSPNGHVTSRIFDHWLYSHFMPYVSANCPDDGNNKILLIMCGKLPLVDKQLWKRVSDENKSDNSETNKFKLHFFMLPSESMQPFNLLFKEKERKRQVDLFTESWRKVTKQLQLGSQFKCQSRVKFKDIFTEAFQNCIEEIGLHTNDKTVNEELNDSFVKYFGKRMSNTFEACKLWPLLN